MIPNGVQTFRRWRSSRMTFSVLLLSLVSYHSVRYVTCFMCLLLEWIRWCIAQLHNGTQVQDPYLFNPSLKARLGLTPDGGRPFRMSSLSHSHRKAFSRFPRSSVNSSKLFNAPASQNDLWSDTKQYMQLQSDAKWNDAGYALKLNASLVWQAKSDSFLCNKSAMACCSVACVGSHCCMWLMKGACWQPIDNKEDRHDWDICFSRFIRFFRFV